MSWLVVVALYKTGSLDMNVIQNVLHVYVSNLCVSASLCVSVCVQY